MLDDPHTSDLERAKQFWHRYRSSIIGGLVLALAGFAGINGWRWYQADQRERAAALYAELPEAEAPEAIAEQLIEAHPNSAYAAQAALYLAADAVRTGSPERALEPLRWVIERAPVLGDIARLRLAAVHLMLGQGEAALTTLSESALEGFAGRRAELRGDAHHLLGDLDAARTAYRESLTHYSPAMASLVALKLETLGGP